jgi:hypothetical protein
VQQCQLFSQTTFKTSYSTPDFYFGYGTCIKPAKDGNYIIGGIYANYWHGSDDNSYYGFHLSKITPAGDTLWFKNVISYSSYEYYNARPEFLETSDGGFYVWGTNIDTTDWTPFVYRLDSLGNILWKSGFQPVPVNRIYDAVLSDDGGLIITTLFEVASNLQSGLLKMNDSGNIDWYKIYNPVCFTSEYGSWDSPYSLEKTSDGHLLISGYSAYCDDYYVMKVDSLGNQIWTKNFDECGHGWDGFTGSNTKIMETDTSSNEYFLMICDEDTGYWFRTYIYKLDANGDSLWKTTIWSDTIDYFSFDIESDHNGGLTISGAKYQKSWNNTQIWLCNIDSLGVIKWEYTYKGDCEYSDLLDFGYDIEYVSDGYIVTGNICKLYWSAIEKNEILVLKTNHNGNVLLNSNNVWPGDANSDLIANNSDLLNIGLAYGTTGTVRALASNSWVAQASTDWGSAFSNGVDYKNADCNGDGSINDDDTLAIYLNYGLTHNKTITINNGAATDPPLYLVANKDTVGTTQTVTIDIYLGSSLIPADSVYGIAFSINYDVKNVDTTSLNVDFSSSWMGNSSNSLSLAYDLPSIGKLDLAFTRKDIQNVSGYGVLGNVQWALEDNLSGKDTIYKTLHFTLSDIKLISKDESVINVNTLNDSIVAVGPAGIKEIDISDMINLFPNPAKEVLNIRLPDKEYYSLTLYNTMGKTILEASINNEVNYVLATDELEQGYYFIEIISTDKNSRALKSFVKM